MKATHYTRNAYKLQYGSPHTKKTKAQEHEGHRMRTREEAGSTNSESPPVFAFVEESSGSDIRWRFVHFYFAKRGFMGSVFVGLGDVNRDFTVGFDNGVRLFSRMII